MLGRIVTDDGQKQESLLGIRPIVNHDSNWSGPIKKEEWLTKKRLNLTLELLSLLRSRVQIVVAQCPFRGWRHWEDVSMSQEQEIGCKLARAGITMFLLWFPIKTRVGLHVVIVSANISIIRLVLGRVYLLLWSCQRQLVNFICKLGEVMNVKCISTLILSTKITMWKARKACLTSARAVIKGRFLSPRLRAIRLIVLIC